MLKDVLWPKIRNLVKREHLYFQQDGARVHTTKEVRDWLENKFHGRVLSDKMNVLWPARSPDLSPLDYWFWGIALAELRKHQPSCLDNLKEIVESLAESLTKEEISKAVCHTKRRAIACLESLGSRFEQNLKKSILKDGDHDD